MPIVILCHTIPSEYLNVSSLAHLLLHLLAFLKRGNVHFSTQIYVWCAFHQQNVNIVIITTQRYWEGKEIRCYEMVTSLSASKSTPSPHEKVSHLNACITVGAFLHCFV